MLIASAIRDQFADIDMLYLGDTLHLPYGNRSAETIFQYCKASMDFMFAQGCRLIIVACNTASATALRRLQQEYLPERYPDRRILGVVVPTIEEALDKGYKRLGVIGTNYTVSTNVYEEELKKLNPEIHIKQQKSPLLVPLIEHGGQAWLDDVMDHYIEPMISGDGLEALLLGCTHYVLLKDRLRAHYGFDVMSQDEIIPPKLVQYFDNHPEIYRDLTHNGFSEFYLTDINENYQQSASEVCGVDVELKLAEL
ncbi:MAG: aspartate/glutamate racemase family protein [Micavibrio sp.]|nr:aspartate/glutamate racemase family protein [Micavibrio sp.]